MTLSQGRRPLDDVSQQEAQRELDAVLSYPDIARSANMVRMLRFICTKYFAGRSDEIRESAIAVQALGRREGAFDSQADPIVRVTARMLRKRLETFYRGEGRYHAVRLELPVGRYIPHFVYIVGNALADDGPLFALIEPSTPEIPLPEFAPCDVLEHVSVAHVNKSTVESPPLHSNHKRVFLTKLAVVVAFILACAISFCVGRTTVVAFGNGDAEQSCDSRA